MTDTEQMRERIDRQRDEIGHSVDQFGNDEPDFPPPRGERYRYPGELRSPYRDTDVSATDESDGGARERMGEAASSVQHAPTAIRRQTRGNPMAAGAIALGAGWLIGSLLPESRSERRAVQRVEPQLAGAAAEARDEARALAEDLREPARDAADQVKDRGRDAARDVEDQANQSARNVRQSSRS